MELISSLQDVVDAHLPHNTDALSWRNPAAVQEYTYARQASYAPSAKLHDIVNKEYGAKSLRAADPTIPAERALIDTMLKLTHKRDICPPPTVCIADTPKPNAAIVLGKDMVFTTGALKHFSHEQIEAVTAHELSHYRHHERDTLVQVGTFGAVVGGMFEAGRRGIGHMAKGTKAWSQNKVAGVSIAAGMVLFPVAQFITRAVLTPYRFFMEYEADKEGAELTSPRVMKETLQTLTQESERMQAEANAAKAHTPHAVIDTEGLSRKVYKKWMYPLGSHPSTENRIAALDKMEQKQGSAGMRFAQAEEQRQSLREAASDEIAL